MKLTYVFYTITCRFLNCVLVAIVWLPLEMCSLPACTPTTPTSRASAAAALCLVITSRLVAIHLGLSVSYL
jgi:hypothetical protein